MSGCAPGRRKNCFFSLATLPMAEVVKTVVQVRKLGIQWSFLSFVFNSASGCQALSQCFNHIELCT